MPQVLDIEQAVLLLEIDPPFDKRDIQLARRRQAKRWHPDIAPPGKQLQHERHLKAVNEAADQLERLAEDSRGGKVTRNAVKVSAAAARKRRAEDGARAYAEEQRQRAQQADQAKHDPFGSRVPDHSVVHRYARCLSYPEWGVGSVNGIYFTGDGDDIQQWARVSFNQGIRTVPAGSLQFVDFTKPDPGAERVERFMTAAKHALAEGELRARGPAARLRARRRSPQPRRAAAAHHGLLAGRRLRRGGARRARLDPAGGRAARRRTGRRRASTRTWARSARRSTPPSGRPSARRPTPRRGSGSAACACAASTARARTRRWSAPARSRPARRACSTSRSWRTCSATSAPRSRPASRRRSSRPTRPAPGRGSRTRSPARTAPRSASRRASARSPCATTPRCATCASRCSRWRRARCRTESAAA